MAEQIQLRCARAYPKQIQKVREWFQQLEDVMEDEHNAASDYGDWLSKHHHEVEGEWERILFGYETMFDNACDPNLSYLAFKPEILQKLEIVEPLLMFRNAVQEFMLSRLAVDCFDIGEVEAKYPELAKALHEVAVAIKLEHLESIELKDIRQHCGHHASNLYRDENQDIRCRVCGQLR